MLISIYFGALVNSCTKLDAIFTIKVVRVEAATSSHINESTMDIDNHADTMVLGTNFLPIYDYGRSVDVYGWDVSAGSFECPTISGAIAYDHPISGKLYMLVYNQTIHCPRFTSHLMCTMQSIIACVFSSGSSSKNLGSL